jgi:hypothetical protein
VLPEPTTTAVALGELPGVREALESFGVAVVPLEAGTADVIVTDGAHLDTAMGDTTARTLVVAGRHRRRRLRRADFLVTSYLVRSGPHGPRIVVAVGARRALRRLLIDRAATAPAYRRARNRILSALLSRRWLRPPSALTVATREHGAPFLVRAATDHGLSTDFEWFLDLREGKAAQRWSFHVFPKTARVDEPGWIVKFGAGPDARRACTADVIGLDGIRAAAPRAAAMAPMLLGRGNVGGLDYSVETLGGPLTFDIALQATRREQANLRLVSDVIDWILEMNQESLSDVRAAEPERARLEAEVLARWRLEAPACDPLPALSRIPGTAIHGDLGPWNVCVDGNTFTIIDWELFRPAGLALWDVLSFATECYAMIGAPRAGWVARRLALLRGELTTSSRLFATVDRGFAALDLDPAAAGALATMRWLAFSVEDHPDPFGANTRPVQMARAWLDDPALGIGWTAWTAWRADRR